MCHIKLIQHTIFNPLKNWCVIFITTSISLVNYSLSIMTYNTCFGNYLHSVGTEHGDLHQMSVTMSRVTYSTLRAIAETAISHSSHRDRHQQQLT